MDKNKNFKSSYQHYHDLDDSRNDLRKHANQEKFAPAQTPTASIVPQLWNPRHMLGFEEFKVSWFSRTTHNNNLELESKLGLQ